MTQEQGNSLLRTILTLIGAFLTGGGLHYFFGHVIDTAYWEQITGVAITLSSMIWSVATKAATIEMIQGGVRQLLTFICGILAAHGLLTDQTTAAIIGFAGSIIPYLQSFLAMKKSDQLVAGAIKPAELKTSK